MPLPRPPLGVRHAVRPEASEPGGRGVAGRGRSTARRPKHSTRPPAPRRSHRRQPAADHGAHGAADAH
eukprot:9446561-Pyramimonas_sp.AAC.1